MLSADKSAMQEPFPPGPAPPPMQVRILIEQEIRGLIGPSAAPRGTAVAAEGRASAAASTAKGRNRLIDIQYCLRNCALHQWNVRKL